VASIFQQQFNISCHNGCQLCPTKMDIDYSEPAIRGCRMFPSAVSGSCLCSVTVTVRIWYCGSCRERQAASSRSSVSVVTTCCQLSATKMDVQCNKLCLWPVGPGTAVPAESGQQLPAGVQRRRAVVATANQQSTHHTRRSAEGLCAYLQCCKYP